MIARLESILTLSLPQNVINLTIPNAANVRFVAGKMSDPPAILATYN